MARMKPLPQGPGIPPDKTEKGVSAMGFPRKITISLSLALLGVVIWYQDAHAYIDPAAGSYFLQLLLSGLLGGAFVVKVFWKNIRAHLSRHSRDDRHEGR